jgi:hypothetical protein
MAMRRMMTFQPRQSQPAGLNTSTPPPLTRLYVVEPNFV